MEDKNKKIQEMQILEQNLQNILYQKQAFQMELSETNSALKELESSGNEAFKIIGQFMLKTEKSKIKEELSNKKKILDLRTKTIEQQEASMMEKLEKLREEILKERKK